MNAARLVILVFALFGPSCSPPRGFNFDRDATTYTPCTRSTPCSSGACVRGACRDCEAPLSTVCSGMCTDTASDENNCGACGRACANGSRCRGGQCLENAPVPVDMVFLVDNSNSMRENEEQLVARIGAMVDALVSPPCVNPAQPTPHACDATNSADTPVRHAAADLRIGVISSDLGTPGSSVPGCANSDLGDDGLLNPIRNGQALARHEPWISAPPEFPRPFDCTDPNQFPSWITFDSATTAEQFTHDAICNTALYVNGCGMESQLEALYRGLCIHGAATAGTGLNAGFIRPESVLAIVVLSDEEDGSIRDCRFADGMPCEGTGTIDVYDPASTAWADMELGMRFYMDRPCSPSDPTWPIDRYIDPTNPTSGFLSLKPGHPERIVFMAIAGVPNVIPHRADGTTDWDGLLGTPGPGGPNDFCHRDSSHLGNIPGDEGPVSMQQAHRDPNCSQRVVPACRRAGTAYDPAACTTDVQYFAWPGRRIVEVARRFDESPMCGDRPCRNGIVASICGRDYQTAFDYFVQRIGAKL